MNLTYKPGQRVAFAQAVIRRSGDQPFTAAARGVIVGAPDRYFARVDWQGTWIPDEYGSTVRTVHTSNLTPILANGAVFGD